MSENFKKLFREKPAYISYLTAGDGGLDFSEKAMHALVKGGVDILEVGVPFSDPIADGPIIQRATQRALKNQVSVLDCLSLIKNFKSQSQTPVVLFSYFNPILSATEKRFFEKAKMAGVDAILVVDLPYEEAKLFQTACLQVDIAPIFIISPASSVQRIQTINQLSRGFLYYACRKGTTGLRNALPEDFCEKITTIKNHASLPVVAGFGIHDRATAKEVIDHANGFVVGSYFVDAIEKGAAAEDLYALAKQLDPRYRHPAA